MSQSKSGRTHPRDRVELRKTANRWRDESLSATERHDLWEAIRETEHTEDDDEIKEYDFGRTTPEDKLKWFDQEKTTEDIREGTEMTDAGSRTMKAAYTSYIEFHLDEPSGASKECTCNECWNTFYAPPFSSAVECPYCHARGINIHEEEHLS